MQVFDKLMHHDVEQIAIAAADWPTYAGKVGKPRVPGGTSEQK